MASIIVTAGQNPPEPTANPDEFFVEIAYAHATNTGIIKVLANMAGGNPTPGIRAAIKAGVIAEAALQGNVFGGSDKVISLVDPVVN